MNFLKIVSLALFVASCAKDNIVLIDAIEIDDSEDTKLKSYTKETGFRGWIGAGYEFAF